MSTIETGRKITKAEWAWMVMKGLVFIAQLVLCFIFYNQLGIDVVIFLGWATILISLVIGWQARVAFEKKGEARAGESFIKTRTVVSSGIYAIIRHPVYLSFMLFSFALMCLSQHWLNIVMGIIVIGVVYNDMRREEQSSLKKFGDEYRNYMEKVPRMNLAVGILKRIWRFRRK